MNHQRLGCTIYRCIRLWKINESLLNDEHYSTLIKSSIVNVVQQHAIPVDSKSFISNPTNFEETQFTINISLFYETLLMLIRGETIKYSKQKVRKVRIEEEVAINEISRLQKVCKKSGTYVDLQMFLNAQENLEKK